ncbi:MAG TPA: DUF6415 family natural product biosynthesis protein [Streptosporangiaceae bacterium]|nr:DUF6415 family natural product biosynthesis protein [Streptosporangiaceae bacterium]
MTGTVGTASDTAPVDVATMRETVGRLLPPGEAPADAELATLTSLLRGHMALLIPEVEAAVAKLPEDDIPRYCALACAGEARGRLRAQPSPAPGGRIAYARRLARSLNALCDHYEALTGVTMCVACDKPIQDADDSLPYDHVSPSGGALRAGRIHARCTNTVRRH